MTFSQAITQNQVRGFNARIMSSVHINPEYRGPIIGAVGLVLFLPQLLPLISEEATQWSFFIGDTVLISWTLGLLGMVLTFVGAIIALNELMKASKKLEAQRRPFANLLNVLGCLCPMLAIGAFVVTFLAALSSVSRWN